MATRAKKSRGTSRLAQYRQGDVLIERIASLPTGAKPIPPEGGRVILAHGEITGHAHALSDRVARLFGTESDQDRYLQVDTDTELQHEEHSAIPLEKGTYRVRRQREYQPDAIRNVAD